MPETDTTPVSASIASTGLGIRYIGNYAYAYSGGIGVDNNNTLILDFSTAGNGFIIAEIQIGSEAGVSEDFRYSVTFNGIKIMDSYANNTFQESPSFAIPIKLIIPPSTHVEVNADNLGSPTQRTTYATLTGRVYGAE